MASRNYEKLVMMESMMDHVDLVILDAELIDIAHLLQGDSSTTQ